VWVNNLRAHPDVEVRDKTEVFKMRVREVEDDPERQRLWDAGAKAYPPYNDYQAKTSRKIPVFIAEAV
jgi:deazaflavin-dependent oxidoreductase (nitroreductase family)